MRRKVAVYIDYVLRTPNFKASFDSFKESLFSDKDFDVELEDGLGDNDVRLYWREQMRNKEIEAFYLGKKSPSSDYDLRATGFEECFFNKEHYHRFLDEYSVNLYIDAQIPNPQDVDVLNVAQEHLFDIVLIDKYLSRRKKGNTLFYLSKIRIYPQQIIWIGEGQHVNQENYFGIWDPSSDPGQVNRPNDKSFIEWFKQLEAKQKETENNG